jgi:hypothetical protein
MEHRVKLVRVVVHPSSPHAPAQSFEATEGVRLSCWWPEEEGSQQRLLVRELDEATGAFTMQEWPSHSVGRVVRTHA